MNRLTRTLLTITCAALALGAAPNSSPGGSPLAAPGDEPAAPIAASRSAVAVPAATEVIAGNSLAFTAAHRWDRAALRVAGPGGYELLRTFAAGEPISVDVKSRERGATLAPGRYGYELRLIDRAGTPRERVLNGVLYAENGTLVSRSRTRARLDGARAELLAARGSTPGTRASTENDDFRILDDDMNEDSLLWMGNEKAGSGYKTYWRIQNVLKDLDFVYHYFKPGTGTMTDTQAFTFTRDAHFGIGIFSPSNEVHIFPQLRTYGSGLGETDRRRPEIYMYAYSDSLALPMKRRGWEIGANEGQFWIRDKGTDATGTNRPIVVGADAPDGALTVSADSIRLASNLSVPWGEVSTGVLKLASSRTTKHQVAAVDPAAMLDRLASLPVAEWSFKSDEHGTRHIGPMAEDFHAAFALDGQSDKQLSVTDVQGVTIAAVQALRTENDDLRVRLGALHDDRERQAAESARLQARLDEIETLLRGLAGGDD